MNNCSIFILFALISVHYVSSAKSNGKKEKQESDQGYREKRCHKSKDTSSHPEDLNIP